jgi:hypothetical protein
MVVELVILYQVNMILKWLVVLFFVSTAFNTRSPASENSWKDISVNPIPSQSQSQNEFQEFDPNLPSMANVIDAQVGLEDEIEHDHFLFYVNFQNNRYIPLLCPTLADKVSRIDRPPSFINS